ncbi:unnamed protein product [Vitrella brassicaformis CCMP3155]|uniref:XPG-I domain-containing protein n=2 Tax=Vitrella brassicaformis TaxID=1169539 RepID=A0A0G4EXX1_VITBC|nr:unnamed protein product [Vitrella brassicaformis CCMP3155]|eukprot:CEM03255.1 unnamed protein product [Vitrella brassicaformis CCMP3155]
MTIKGFHKLFDDGQSCWQNKTAKDYAGQKVAIDFSILLYQVSTVESHVPPMRTLLFKLLKILEAGIIPVIVFDGAPPRQKLRTKGGSSLSNRDADRPLAASPRLTLGAPRRSNFPSPPRPPPPPPPPPPPRAFPARTCGEDSDDDEYAIVTIGGGQTLPPADTQHIASTPPVPPGPMTSQPSPSPSPSSPRSFARESEGDIKRLLDMLGIPWVAGPGEADATCAILVQTGKCDVAASEDYDVMVFGASRLVRGLLQFSAADKKRRTSQKIARVTGGGGGGVTGVREFSLPSLLAHQQLTREQLVDVSLLMGCDYYPGVSSLGPVKASQLIRQHGSIEHLPSNIRSRLPRPRELYELRQLFLAPPNTQQLRQSSRSYHLGPLPVSSDAQQQLYSFLMGEKHVFNQRGHFESVVNRIEKLADARRQPTQLTLNSFFTPSPKPKPQPGQRSARMTIGPTPHPTAQPAAAPPAHVLPQKRGRGNRVEKPPRKAARGGDVGGAGAGGVGIVRGGRVRGGRR